MLMIFGRWRLSANGVSVTVGVGVVATDGGSFERY
jgi:hypothetical protein